MSAAPFVVALSLATVSLVFLAPPADAFGWCTFADVPDHQCRYYYACIGWGWGYRYGGYYETCQYGVGPWHCLYDGVCPPPTLP